MAMWRVQDTFSVVTARNSASAACMASSAAAPKRSKRRPPKAMLQAAKPCPTEKEPCDDVGEPVHVEQDARARHGDGDTDGCTGEDCAAMLADASAENQKPPLRRTQQLLWSDRSGTTAPVSR